MRIELTLVSDVDATIENACLSGGFVATEIALRTKPRARHWHIQRKGVSGTVEITFDVDRGDFILEVRRGRLGKLTEAEILRFAEALQQSSTTD